MINRYYFHSVHSLQEQNIVNLVGLFDQHKYFIMHAITSHKNRPHFKYIYIYIQYICFFNICFLRFWERRISDCVCFGWGTFTLENNGFGPLPVHSLNNTRSLFIVYLGFATCGPTNSRVWVSSKFKVNSGSGQTFSNWISNIFSPDGSLMDHAKMKTQLPPVHY